MTLDSAVSRDARRTDRRGDPYDPPVVHRPAEPGAGPHSGLLPGTPLPGAQVYEAPDLIGAMLLNVGAFLWSLSAEQRARASYPMAAPQRLDWDFVPKPDRSGIPIADLDKHQRILAQRLVASGLSMRGYTQALSIMSMENVLREVESHWAGGAGGYLRHPDGYYLSVFGRPAMEDTWGWRILGHHLSLSYTVIGQRYLSVTPCNMGAQPVSAGVLNPLREDDALGFELLDSLRPEQRAQAVIHHRAPADFVTRQVPHVGAVEYPDHYDLGILWYRLTDEDREILKFVRDEPSGICASALDHDQQATLMSLVDCFLGRFPAEVSDPHRDRLLRRGTDELFFSWAGGDRPGTSHYYRLHGRDMLIEFDNAIGSGDHIHSNWRDLDNDLGRGLLLDHYEQEQSTGHHLASRLNSSVPHGPAR